MSSLDVTTRGVDTFVSTLGDASREMGDLAPPEAGAIWAEEAQRRAPRRGGRLAASVRPVVAQGLVSVTSDTAYAPPIHNGWIADGRTYLGRPFIIAAAQTTEPRLTTAYETAAQGVLDQVRGA